MIIEATPEGVLLGALGILAATASTVAASVSRQENLSSRMRTLCKEFRDLDHDIELNREKNTNPSPQRLLRLHALPTQILEFRERLRPCITAHICLYIALALEAVGVGLVFLAEIRSFWSSQRDSHKFAISAFVLMVVAFFLLIVGLINHIREYSRSGLTLDMELSDIHVRSKQLDAVFRPRDGQEAA